MQASTKRSETQVNMGFRFLNEPTNETPFDWENMGNNSKQSLLQMCSRLKLKVDFINASKQELINTLRSSPISPECVDVFSTDFSQISVFDNSFLKANESDEAEKENTCEFEEMENSNITEEMEEEKTKEVINANNFNNEIQQQQKILDTNETPKKINATPMNKFHRLLQHTRYMILRGPMRTTKIFFLWFLLILLSALLIFLIFFIP